MKRISVLALLISCSLIQAVAQDARGSAALFRHLRLTDQQRPEVERLQAEHLKRMIDLRAKTASAGVDLRYLLRADAPQQAAIEKKIKEIADLKAQTAALRLGHWFAVQKLLTAEQQSIWKRALVQSADSRAPRRPSGRVPRGMGRQPRQALPDDRPRR